ncbi:hypothetical protein L596_004573 [Steinernema carpocapsae]|uniref:Uncharacterized protein n=1 Tax=Steinernema carpocapsae TaxID=34508 RepID=A0A4V6I8E0_STECR|nr:hypothetical protein L596_004573 [Steinernema carpocapsae]
MKRGRRQRKRERKGVRERTQHQNAIRDEANRAQVHPNNFLRGARDTPEAFTDLKPRKSKLMQWTCSTRIACAELRGRQRFLQERSMPEQRYTPPLITAA